LGLLAFLVFIGAMGALVWMLFLPHLVAWRLEARTGFPTRIERLAANPLTGTLRLEGLVMENPAGFEPRTFMAVNVLAADLRLTSLLRRELVFETVELDLARVSLVTRRDGTNNLGLLHEALRAENLPALGWRWDVPTGGLYLWLEAPPTIDTRMDHAFCRACVAAGVLYVPGELCFGDMPTPRHVRLSFGVLTEADLVEAARRFGRVAREFAREAIVTAPADVEV
jgi:hypothetical protein